MSITEKPTGAGRIRRRVVRAAAAIFCSTALAVVGTVATTAPVQAEGQHRIGRLQFGQTAHFANFDVTVLGATMDSSYYGYVLKLRVCVTRLPAGSKDGKTRISWDPWTVSTNRGVHRPAVQEDPPPQTFPRPYDSEGWFKKGECATGWLPFWGLKATETVKSINYANSLGNRASWRQPRLVISQQETFRYFSVRVLHVEKKAGWYGVYARTCARALPPGTRGRSVRVSWEPWSLATNRGIIALRNVEGPSPFKRIYPYQTRIKPGRCVTGWLPFSVPSKTSVRSIRYANSLGEGASWQGW
jgi:hypothetical protein